MGRNHVVIAVVGLALVFGCLGCGGKKESEGGTPKVAVSIFPLYDLTRRIAGDRAEVILVLPPGKSEHGYDPTPKEIARLTGTKLAIAVGLDMDTWVENIMRTAGGSKVIHVGKGVKTMPIDVEPIGEEEAGHEHEGHTGEKGHDDHTGAKGHKDDDDHDDHKGDDDRDDHDGHGKAGAGSAGTGSTGTGSTVAGSGGAGSASAGSAATKHESHEEDDHDDHGHASLGAPDPHVWLDPERMLGVVDMLAGELTAIDPAGKDVYAKNAEALKSSIREVDSKIGLRSKAWTKRTIVTFHGSMAYFAKRYKIRIAAVVEPIAGKEPTAAYIAEVIGAIKRGKATALFSEPQLDRGPGEMIAKEAGIPLGELDPIGGVPGRDTYETLLLWNTDQLEKVLK